MALNSQASHAIVPAITCSSSPEQGLAAHCNETAMQAKEFDEHDQEQLSGFIFMCNGRTKPQCYMYRVFGLPLGKLEVVKRIKPGMKLFLFDFEMKLLYGIYEATSVGTLNLEQTAFGGRFPAQVCFKIYRDCLPLHESSFRHLIEYNYQKRFKFKQELNKQQVGSLLSLFSPLTESVPGSLQPMRVQAVQNQSALPFSKGSSLQVLESQQVQQAGLQQGMGCAHPVDPNVTGLQLSYAQPVSEPQKILSGAPSLQQHYFGTTTNMQHSDPTMATQVLLTSNYQYYMPVVQQPYAPGNPTQNMPDYCNSYMGIHQQLAVGNTYHLPLQREGETAQQQESLIKYNYSNQSPATPYITPPAADGSLPLAYVSPFAGAAPTHY